MIEEFKSATKYVQDIFKVTDKRIIQIEKESIESNVPIITRDVLQFMLFMANNIESKNILEIGTATGYSGIFLSQICKKNNGYFVSIEIDDKRHNVAKRNFETMHLTDISNLILGDALEIIPNLENYINEKMTYDFIFIDASKGQYEKFFNMSYELLNEGGIIFIDNIMFRGLVTLDDDQINKKYKSMVTKLKKFITKLHTDYYFSLLPFGDGVGLVYKK